MIVIVVLIWTVASIIDIIDNFFSYGIVNGIDSLEYYSSLWLLCVYLIVIAIFLYSCSLYFG